MVQHSLVPLEISSGIIPAFRTNIFGSLQREVDRLFDDVRQGLEQAGEMTPRLDMSETPSELEITAELPGLAEKDVEVSLCDDILTISGEKQAETERSDQSQRLVERSYGSFRRSVRLPAGVDASGISASLARGVLKVVVRKPIASAAARIPVKTEH